MGQSRVATERRTLAPSATVTGGAAVGTPLAVTLLWYLNSYVLPAPMPDEVSIAAGALIVSLVSYATQVIEVLLSKLVRD